jgi:ABC-type antimicrobial peptide transport system permease subunit
MTFAARVGGDPRAIAGPVRRAIAEIDSDVPVLAVRTQDAQIDTAVSRERVFAYAASGFAVLALGLACLGIYGMLNYSVTRRTHEIGLRMALGADRRDVVSLVIRQSFLPVAAGLTFGFGIVVATTRYVQSMLFELTPYDGPTLVLAACGLILSALLAAWLPARRASAVDRPAIRVVSNARPPQGSSSMSSGRTGPCGVLGR